MKLILTTLLSILLLNAHAADQPIDKDTADALHQFFVKNVTMRPNDDYARVGKTFKGATVFELWMKIETGSIGLQVVALKQGDRIQIFPNAREAAVSLLKAHEDKLTNADEVRELMSAITTVTEVKEPEKGTYHVFDGNDFFDALCGYVVKVENGRIVSCEYELKLSEK